MSQFKCTSCRHPVSILMYYPDTGEAVCRLCREIGRHSPPKVLRALGFLFRVSHSESVAGRMKAKTISLISHDRALRGAA